MYIRREIVELDDGIVVFSSVSRYRLLLGFLCFGKQWIRDGLK